MAGSVRQGTCDSLSVPGNIDTALDGITGITGLDDEDGFVLVFTQTGGNDETGDSPSADDEV